MADLYRRIELADGHVKYDPVGGSRTESEYLREIERLTTQLAWHNRFVGWVDSWVGNLEGSYSVGALDGLFAMTRDKIAELRKIEAMDNPPDRA